MSGPFEDMLVHTCTITTMTDSGAKRAYGQGVMTPTDTTGVACRFSRPRFTEMTDDAGNRLKVDGKLFIKFSQSIDIGATVKDIKDAAGAAVASGTFDVIDVVAASSASAGHHREVFLRRG